MNSMIVSFLSFQRIEAMSSIELEKKPCPSTSLEAIITELEMVINEFCYEVVVLEIFTVSYQIFVRKLWEIYHCKDSWYATKNIVLSLSLKIHQLIS